MTTAATLDVVNDLAFAIETAQSCGFEFGGDHVKVVRVEPVDDHVKIYLSTGRAFVATVTELERAPRKAHVHVEPERYVDLLAEVGSARLDDLAEHLNVSQATARRRLDGLVARGLVRLLRDRPREYGRSS